MGGKDFLNWPTNLMGKLRLELQMEQYGAQYIGLALCFITLCIFTLMFTITYLKRVLHMAFLTLIAPLVALTYCIDKINDGQAQGFNKWFKEYIFNLLIQPMHLLLYYILVSSAFELSSQNVIYSLVAIGFMIPAEKLLRSLFGFEKAQTAPGMTAAGALMASTALNSLLHKGPKGGGKNGGSKGDGSDPESEKVPMPRESGNPMDAFPGERTEERPGIGSGEDNGTNEGNNQGNDEGNPMLDAYDEKYGTEEWDAQERDGIAREVYADDQGRQYSDDEYADILRDSGYSEEEIQAMMGEQNGEETEPRTVEPPEEPEQPEQLTAREQRRQQRQERRERRRESIGRTAVGRRVLRNIDASKAAQKAYMRQIPNHLKRKIENAHPIRTMGKIAAGAALGTVAGAVGIAAATASGDLGNITKVGLGSAAAGYAVGSGAAQRLKSPMDDPKVQKVRDEAYNKGQYKEDAMNDYVRKYLKDAETRSYFEQKFGAAEAKKMLEKGGEVEEYLYNDINDKKEMAAIHKLQTKGIVKSREEAIAVSQLGQMIGSNTNNMTTKTRNEWKTRLAEMAGKSGIKDKKDQNAFAEKRLKEIDKLHDFKK